MVFVDVILIATTGLLIVPFAVFWMECILALLPRKRRQPTELLAEEVWVVIPAHNEAAVISDTLSHLKRTLNGNTSVLVIADNCDDDTARIALDEGCHVLERSNKVQRGKGFALQFACEYLTKTHSPSVVVILDADCEVGRETITQISSLAFQTNRPVQGLNLSTSPHSTSKLSTLSELGFRFKNLVRPSGLLRIGMPCHLMGTGIAIPWSALANPQTLSDDLAEDMQLGVDLAVAGYPTYFYPDVEVSSQLPQNQSGFMTQRTRWEQGHLQTSLKQIPILIRQSIRQRRIDLLMLALDLTIPPFSLLMISWACVLFLSLLGWIGGASVWPLVIMAVAGGTTALTIFCCWLKFCRDRIPFSSLVFLPFYALRKVPIYLSFLSGRAVRQWVRTER
ncbi:MAG: glycosyltransferase family 2 protein [Planctomycetaceae bacterium]|nr:glycosyltransferase family 2 protein [Planctomycetaceae bacterium]